jgi:hypothetical protein
MSAASRNQTSQALALRLRRGIGVGERALLGLLDTYSVLGPGEVQGQQCWYEPQHDVEAALQGLLVEQTGEQGVNWYAWRRA